MYPTKSLLVVWKNKATQIYYHVGTLTYDGEKYTFQYTYHRDTHRKVKEAMRNGYKLHPAFPDLNKIYISSALFASFDRRIPSIDRVDYNYVLNHLNLPLDADRMDILRETRGMLSGDAYSFEEPLRLYEDEYLKAHFYINGMRHQDLLDDWHHIIKVGDYLVAVPEIDNEFDPYAVQIKTRDGIQLGYIPGIYAQAVKALLKREVVLTLTVKNIRPTLASQWWVQVGLLGQLTMKEPDIFKEKDLNGLIFKAA